MKQISIIGHIGANAEVRINPTTQAKYVTFRVAVNSNVKKDDKTYWFNCSSYTNAHVNMAQYLTKGKPIIVSGMYADRAYISNVTNQPEVARDIYASHIEFLNIGTQQNTQGGATVPQATPASVTPQPVTMNNTIPQVAPTPAPSVATTPAPAMAASATPAVQDSEVDDLPF